MRKKTNKQIRRDLRHERNKRRDTEYKRAAWESGKLIEENYNKGYYSPEYTISLSERLIKYLKAEYKKAEQSDKQPKLTFLLGFRKYKKKIQDLILHWSPEVSKSLPGYVILKGMLESYWDDVLEDGKPELLYGIMLQAQQCI